MNFTFAKIGITFFTFAATILICETSISQDVGPGEIEIATPKHRAQFPTFIVPLRHRHDQETQKISAAASGANQRAVVTASASSTEKVSENGSESALKSSSPAGHQNDSSNAKIDSSGDSKSKATEEASEDLPTNILRTADSENSSILLRDSTELRDDAGESSSESENSADSKPASSSDNASQGPSPESSKSEPKTFEIDDDSTFHLGSDIDDDSNDGTSADSSSKIDGETNRQDTDRSQSVDNSLDFSTPSEADAAPSPFEISSENEVAVEPEASSPQSELTLEKLRNIDEPSKDIADDPIAYKNQEAPPLMEISSTKLSDQKETTDDLARLAELSKSKLQFVEDEPTRKPPQIADDEGPVEPLSLSEKKLRARIRACMAYYMTHLESVEERSPWAVMHATLPYGVDAELTARGRPVNAIGWMLFNGRCRTQRLFSLKRNGSFQVASGPGVQGHEGQLLAVLAQSFVSPTYPISVNGRKFTVRDLVRYEMSNCRANSELTFQLIGISHYMPTTTKWRSKNGQTWDVPRLIHEELEQPIVGAACGGNHRLFGLTYAVKRRQQEGLPIDGEFRRAAIFIDDFLKYAWTLQNPDGSFSTNWYAGRGNKPDHARKVQTTGHIVEWMVFTLPADQLRHPRMQKSIRYLLSQVLDNRHKDWAIGPRGHAIRALVLYDEKVFGSEPGKRKDQLANEIRAMRRVR